MTIALDTACPLCGLIYADMKTGMTYSCIYSMLWSSSDDPSTWRNRRRHTVLGLWHSIKAGQWNEHLHECKDVQDDIDNKRVDAEEARAEREAIIAVDMFPDMFPNVYLDDVPF